MGFRNKLYRMVVKEPTSGSNPLASFYISLKLQRSIIYFLFEEETYKMANKKTDKYLFDREKTLKVLTSKKLSIRALGRDPNFPWAEKSIRRAFKNGASLGLIDDITSFLGIHAVDILVDGDCDIIDDTLCIAKVIYIDIPANKMSEVKAMALEIATKYGVDMDIQIKTRKKSSL